ncbi:MAG: 2-C-methyl-D-erythritol 2,4-cyclodiphosphate synthase [Deltaproteobacteria bacterium]|nr:MAG: 2-C-methyl-D-erythritol 2,4-cyclodiphosphate synthase [Deltaproteobacteria bacterium]
MTKSSPSSRVFAIITAAGSGQRCPGNRRKQLMPLQDKPLFLWCLEAFSQVERLAGMVLVGPADDHRALEEMKTTAATFANVIAVVPGGDSRQASIFKGLAALKTAAEADDLILIHDGVRPLITPKLINRIIDSHQPGIVIVPVTRAAETVKFLADDHTVSHTIPRQQIGLAQTPQGIPFSLLWDIYQANNKEIWSRATDDAGLVEVVRPDTAIRWIEGDRDNIKITFPTDLALAEALLAAEKPGDEMIQTIITTGFGYDVHRLVPERKLVLGGVDIPFSRGLAGHSDADVAIHALVDAILGAVAAGDIGQHFPDSDPRWHNVSSLEFLAYADKLAADRLFQLLAIDLTIVAQEPKLAPFLPRMRQAINNTLITPCQLNIKATTTEGLGFTGTGEGIAAYAVVTARQRPQR